MAGVTGTQPGSRDTRTTQRVTEEPLPGPSTNRQPIHQSTAADVEATFYLVGRIPRDQFLDPAPYVLTQRAIRAAKTQPGWKHGERLRPLERFAAIRDYRDELARCVE